MDGMGTADTRELRYFVAVAAVVTGLGYAAISVYWGLGGSLAARHRRCVTGPLA
jgi:hypothetical protein